MVESGLISNNNEKIKNVLVDSILQIKFPKEREGLTESKNSYNSNDIYFYGQVFGKSDILVDSVFVKIYKNWRLNDTLSYSSTFSDTEGRFKLPIPEDDNTFKVSFSKKGYVTEVIITSKNASKYERQIHLLQ